MICRSLKQIADMIKIENDLTPFENVMVHGVSIDSRKIESDQLFIPFKGEHSDGHRFVEDAISKGAAAAFWQKDVPNPPTHLPILIVEDCLTALQELSRSYRNELHTKVVGITGSNGKTSTKDMTASLLSLKYKVQKTEGNFNNHIGLPLTILRLDEDTDIAVLEMGMSGKGEIDFLTKLAKPNAVIITNIGEAHLLDLGSREGIAEAKLEILNGLQENGRVIYFGDETLLSERINRNGKIEIKTFGNNHSNDLFPTHINQSSSGSQFKINASNAEYFLPVLGTHNVLNALGAMLVAQYFDISFDEMKNGLNNLKLTGMRMELVEGINGVKIINDAYNASPTSMKAAIDLVSNLPDYEHKLLVLGDMLELGPDEEQFHEQIGQLINQEKISYVFTFGKLGSFIAKGAKAVFPSERVFAFTEKQELIDKVKKYCQSDMIILVKGSRGMKLEEVVASLKEN
ncbi:UDP-N-acetylmuramoyl-tripeptide--D-alanyl-D-alanine ligase [Bacillus sp. 03113]|uniref:UDP-N-acetylmuramoyl-tripeptide--D-alanyl-D- alanine ligase n=1 Tax=Bacillus sp. 03113 TaxID=2578211 RepID=UPI001141F4B5|nr:UDP-N-acetylmuramoyl-tripeptide--D-alanyl-D-alanine ligase [Bacillus sp. 03113]